MCRDVEEHDKLPSECLDDLELLESDEIDLTAPADEDVFYTLGEEGDDPFLELVLREYVLAEPNGLNINSWLRGEYPHITLEATVSETLQAAEEMQRHMEIIDDFIAASELSVEMVVYKGLRRDQLTYIQAPEVFVPEYISTTLELCVAEHFACWELHADAEEPNVVLAIHLEPGQYAFDVYVNTRESEYLLPRGWIVVIQDRHEVEPHKWRLTCCVKPA